VTRDWLALGRDGDSFRYPLTPKSALAVADAAGCTLPTARLCDLVHAAAGVKLEPRPLTQDREALATFFQHHELVEQLLGDAARAALVSGAKKDIVWTARLAERSHKVAIYGWHHPDGRPIQPLYAGHSDRYVDYSHGLRLVTSRMIADGAVTSVATVLADPELCGLLSNEGPLDLAALRKAAQWER
jgi:hypothetical protein